MVCEKVDSSGLHNAHYFYFLSGSSPGHAAATEALFTCLSPCEFIEHRGLTLFILGSVCLEPVTQEAFKVSFGLSKAKK